MYMYLYIYISIYIYMYVYIYIMMMIRMMMMMMMMLRYCAQATGPFYPGQTVGPCEPKTGRADAAAGTDPPKQPLF